MNINSYTECSADQPLGKQDKYFRGQPKILANVMHQKTGLVFRGHFRKINQNVPQRPKKLNPALTE